jgi:hypothetical protein
VSFEFEGSKYNLGTPHSPSQVAVDYVAELARDVLYKRRRSIRDAVDRYITREIENMAYGTKSELKGQLKDFAFVHASRANRWGSQIITDIMKSIFLGGGTWCVRDKLDPALAFPPVPLLQTAVACVSFFFMV